MSRRLSECEADFSSSDCQGVYTNTLPIIQSASGNASTGMVNVYDTRLYAPDGGSESWPSGLNNTAAYLALPTVQRAIHTDMSVPVAWQECNSVRLSPKLLVVATLVVLMR
jgi:hypothetical protein